MSGTHPLRLVRFETSTKGILHLCFNVDSYDDKALLTKGSLATNPSYNMNPISPTPPRINGTRTCAEDHGKFTPPQVNPIMKEVVLATTMRLPLRRNDSVQDKLSKQKFIHPVHTDKFFP